MSVAIFLGEPPAHIKQWIIDHPPVTEEPDPVDTSDWGQLVAALEDCQPSDFNGLNYIGSNPVLAEKTVGSGLGVQYKIDGTTAKTTTWLNLGYNASIPEYAKYRRAVGSGWRHVWVKTVKSGLLAPIAVGDAIYTRTYDSTTSDYSYTEYDVIDTIGSGTFTYGNNCIWAVPMSFTTVGGKSYDFCGYNMTLNSEALLTTMAFDPNAPRPCFLTGTKITLADNTTKNIEDITYNDTLLVWNFDEGKLDTAPICWLTKSGLKNDHYYKLTFSDGTTLMTTGTNSNHKVYNVDEKFFKGVDKTKIGDRIYSQNGIVTVTNKEYFEQEVEFYNLITTNKFDCFANGILTSDRYGNMYPIDDNMTYIKDGRIIRPYTEFEAAHISHYWYDTLRLGEQTEAMSSTREYIHKLETYMRPLPTKEEA